MRVNLPVHNVETKLREDQYLISRTDTKGRILYANPAFIEVSGFSREELIGKAHNIVRHPDMPPQAYEICGAPCRRASPGWGWSEPPQGRWLLLGVANATPIVENGEVVAYSSVRVRPTDEQIEMAEALYARIREGARGVRIRRADPCAPAGVASSTCWHIRSALACAAACCVTRCCRRASWRARGLWPAGELGCAEHDRRQLRLRAGEPGRGGRFPAGLAPVAFGDGPGGGRRQHGAPGGRGQSHHADRGRVRRRDRQPDVLAGSHAQEPYRHRAGRISRHRGHHPGGGAHRAGNQELAGRTEGQAASCSRPRRAWSS